MTAPACPSCHAALTASAFPGGTVRCAACGTASAMPAPNAPDASPYRTAGLAPAPEPAAAPCPFCGGSAPAGAPACPRCEVSFANVRCPACAARVRLGERACARCGQGLEGASEASEAASGAACPRCDGRLEAEEGAAGMHACTRCGGVFLEHATLADIVHARQEGSLPAVHPFAPAPAKAALEEVRYLKCPSCHAVMNRANFGNKSGVVVDVCRAHGTWFDAGELARVLEWVARGGVPAAPKGAVTVDAQAQASAQVAMMNESMREMRAYGRHVRLTRGLMEAIVDTLLGW